MRGTTGRCAGLLLMILIFGVGCAVTDYPVITDTRGDFSGVVRTGHNAYIRPTATVATIWPDGSDELFTMVYQNQYGDQKLYCYDNFDPTASVVFMDKTYCDWRYDGCANTVAWNPVDSNIDNRFDYEFFPLCSGARSQCTLLAVSSRIGECGDAMFWGDKQSLAAEFAALATTSWRGRTAYIVPLDSANTTVTLTANGRTEAVPVFGAFTAYLDDALRMMIPMTPNASNELRWLSGFVAENGRRARAAVQYNSLTAGFDIAFVPGGLETNINRF